MAKRKLDDAVDESSAEQQIYKSYAIVHTVLLKGNVANARNFFAIYECVTSCKYALAACAVV